MPIYVLVWVSSVGLEGAFDLTAAITVILSLSTLLPILFLALTANLYDLPVVKLSDMNVNVFQSIDPIGEPSMIVPVLLSQNTS